jgi:hypothetical protein
VASFPGPQTNDASASGYWKTSSSGASNTCAIWNAISSDGEYRGEHLLSHMSRTELEGLVTALEAVPDGEGTPMPPLTGS